jgi:D-alanyl-D-alanine carboxypeptidase
VADAVIAALPEAEWERIVAVGAWRPGCPVERAQLRRVEVNFVGFDGAVHRGVLIVNADVAGSVARIFTSLFAARFPIRRMEPIEYYDGNDDASMAADNTSAYNCRSAAQANAPAAASPHANGRAIDVNPWENPWFDSRCDCFEPDVLYSVHRAGAGVILRGGAAWRVFTAAGWIWQDNSTPDYQHFDTGYPSRPL